jgi:hypothetical protein
MIFSQNKRLSFLLLLVIALLIQSCASMNIYQGPEMNSDGIAVIKVIDKDTSISNIDGKATTSLASFAVKGRFEQELTLLPGKHEIVLIHGGWREVSSKAVYELEAQKGYTYLVQSKTVGKSTALWLEDEKSKGRVGSIVESFNEPVVEAVALDTYTSVYSFLPPKESGWIIQKRTYNYLYLWKEGSKEDESFVISITDGQIPSFKSEKEFIDAVEERSSRAALSKRYKNLERKIDPGDPADFCYDTYTLVEDNDAKRKSSRTDLMLVETAYRRCRHQANPNMAAEIYFSRRYYPGDKDLDFMAKAQNVFTSLKYK